VGGCIMSQNAYAIARCRGTWPTRKRTPQGPYRGAMPRSYSPSYPPTRTTRRAAGSMWLLELLEL